MNILDNDSQRWSTGLSHAHAHYSGPVQPPECSRQRTEGPVNETDGKAGPL